MNTNTNIEITNIDKHFFSNSEREDENTNNKYKTKIIQHCFYSINEANISDKIKDIPYYSNNYAIIEDYNFVNISQLNEKLIEKLRLTNDNKYLMFKYKNIDAELIEFRDFLFNFSSPKLFIFHVIQSFSYLLQSLIVLNQNNICFFNLSPQNILFNLDCGEKPIIYDFQLSLQISKLSESYMTNIIKKQNNYTHKSLEIHILFYLINNDFSTISYSFIEEICENFISNLSILTLFSENYKEKYKLSCIEYLKRYINKSKSDIIKDILEQNNKWDVYSLSVLYLHIFGNISRVFSLKGTFINKFTVELSKNIHPEPSKRGSLEELLEKFDMLISYEKDWSFVKKMPSNKMSQLFDILIE